MANARLVKIIPTLITKFCVAKMKLPFPQGIFPWLQSDSRCRRVSQVLWQEPGLQLVVLGASLRALYAFSQLHRGWHRSSCRWALPRLHQWRERVSWSDQIIIYLVLWCWYDFTCIYCTYVESEVAFSLVRGGKAAFWFMKASASLFYLITYELKQYFTWVRV